MRRLALWLLPLALAACYDTMQSEFTDMRTPEAIAMKARGWIPDFVPDEATHILEKHDLDTNDVVVSFTMDAVQARSLFESHGMKATVQGGTDRKPNLSFWPRTYRKRLQGILRKEDVTIYRLKDNLFNTIWYVVLEEGDGFVYLSSRPFLPLEDPDFK